MRTQAAGWQDLKRLVESVGLVALPSGCPFHVAAAVLKPDAAGKRRLVSGRGLSAEDAERGALAEAVERASAVYRPEDDDRLQRASHRELDGAAVDPASLLLVSDDQYRTRKDWNRRVNSEHRLPDPHDADSPIEWLEVGAEGTSRRYVPAAHCLLGFPRASEQGFPVPDSSGLAAGNAKEDAAVRAFHEVVERDAVAIWWYARIPRPAPRIPDSVRGLVEGFSAWLGEQGRGLHLLDLTHDLGVPVVAAVSFDDDRRNLSFGFGAASTTSGAIESALGELVQFDASKRLRAEARQQGYLRFSDWLDWCVDASLDDNPHLVPGGHGVADHSPVAETIEACAALCRARNLELILVDLTRPEIAVPAVKAIVPGSRPLWPRFADGRLYDVPVELGWMSRRMTEDQVNPVHILY